MSTNGNDGTTERRWNTKKPALSDYQFGPALKACYIENGIETASQFLAEKLDVHQSLVASVLFGNLVPDEKTRDKMLSEVTNEGERTRLIALWQADYEKRHQKSSKGR